MSIYLPSLKIRVLLLGGTTQASAIARELAAAGVDAVFSYAGATAQPLPQPLPQRLGGFGGAQGLAQYLWAEKITHVIDCTHPFAAQMQDNARAACAIVAQQNSGKPPAVALLRVQRAPWQAQQGDYWISVPDMAAAARALPTAPTRVFAAIGRKLLGTFAAICPQHWFLLRWVGGANEDGENYLKNIGLNNYHILSLSLPLSELQASKLPISDFDKEITLLRQHRVQWLVSKNAGGAARAKLDAARALGLPVVMVERPTVQVAPPPCFTQTQDWRQALPWVLGKT